MAISQRRQYAAEFFRVLEDDDRNPKVSEPRALPEGQRWVKYVEPTGEKANGSKSGKA